MTAETSKIKSKLLALSASFDDLETQLEPLFSQTLPETIIALEPLQQAKLQTLLPYLVYDLIFIYLKTRGIDPKTHPVVHELDRIREYFEKINLAENPPARRTEIDKTAATRFIKHAIAQAQWKKTAAEADDEDDNNNVTSDNTQQPVSSSSHIPVKMTSKMIQRAAYEKEIKEQDAMEADEDEGDGGLEVFDELPTPTKGKNRQDTKGKGKETALPAIDKDAHISHNKRRRPMVDPFAGYGDDLASPNRSTAKKVKSSENSPQPHRPTSSDLDPRTSTADTWTSSNCEQRSEKRTKKKTKGLATSTSLK